MSRRLDLAGETDDSKSPVARFERLVSLPPSAKLVYKVLDMEGELTQSQLVETTFLPRRTVRYAVTELGAEDLIEEEFNFMDARQKLYRPKPIERPA